MRFLSRSSVPTLLGLALCAWPARGRADDDARAIAPAAPHAVGRVLTAGVAPTGPTLLASGGYGYTGSVLGMADAHHRVAGALTVDERPLPWLDFALRLDGRYDAHVIPGQPTDTGWVGDPRLYARVDRTWPSGLGLGARAGLWLPGRNAPSVASGALSPELLGMASYVSPSAPIAATVNVGYRLDHSAHSAPDAPLLSAGDRLALEVSAFDDVLAGVAVTVGRGPAQGFVEASTELLVGSGAPAAKTSPIFVAGGGRFAPARYLQLEAEIEISPSSRPDVAAPAPLVPIPPRFAAWLGLAYRFGPAPAPPPPPVSPPPAPPPPPPAPHSVEPVAPVAAPPEVAPTDERRPPRGQIRGLVRSLRGTAVAADITVAPEAAATDGAAPEAQQLKAAGGRFEIDVAPGRYRVTIAAPGFETQKRKVEVEENGVTLLNADLRTQK
jgi:hypothetical protein